MCTFVHFVILKAHPRVIVVSAREVVRLHGAILPVALACTSVPLGAPELSVSIRKFKFTEGETTFARASFNVLALTQLPKAGIEILVLSDISQINCSFVAEAKVTTDSAKTTCPALPVSQPINVES